MLICLKISCAYGNASAEQSVDKYWVKCLAPGRRLRFSPGLQTSLIQHSNIMHVSFIVKGNLTILKAIDPCYNLYFHTIGTTTRCAAEMKIKEVKLFI